MPSPIESLLATLPENCPQRQDSSSTQIADIERTLSDKGIVDATNAEKALVANKLGMYDAADLYKLRASKSEARVTT